MEFQFVFEFSYDAGIDDQRDRQPPYEGVYSKDVWEKDMWNCYLMRLREAKAVLDAEGLPKIKYEETTIFRPQSMTREKWEKQGRNHTYGDQQWMRELLKQTWWIEIETLATFVQFCDQHDLRFEYGKLYWES